MDEKTVVDNSIFDPVFLSVGQEVYTYEYVEKLREENLEIKRNGGEVWSLIPQEGFQENVLTIDADLLIIGGKRGGGKSWTAMFYALSYIDIPQASLYAFRKFEDDITRSIWKTSLQVFSGFGTPSPSLMKWDFPSGAIMKMEHLQDPRKLKDRFRGAEMCYIDLEELPEHTVSDLDVVFTLLGSNRNTIGAKSRFVATCNPVGRSNALRFFLEWYIDPDTNVVIPERSGKVRYFYRYGEKSIKEIAWGNTKDEVYNNINAKRKIDELCSGTGKNPHDFISSLCFIEGQYADNKILDAADPAYMNRISSQGGDSTTKDIIGVWSDTDNGDAMISIDDMDNVFNNVEQRTGFKRASADVALTGDFFVLFAFDGMHICDIEAWRGMPSDAVQPFIDNFLSRNGVREENFTYDSNGLGLWLKGYYKRAKEFNNKSASSDSRLWNNLKSECADRFVKSLHQKEWSIAPELLSRHFKDKSGNEFTLRDRLISERQAIKRKETDNGRFEIISKAQMKQEIGHSPDFIEAWFMVHHLLQNTKKFDRKGFDAWCG